MTEIKYFALKFYTVCVIECHQLQGFKSTYFCGKKQEDNLFALPYLTSLLVNLTTKNYQHEVFFVNILHFLLKSPQFHGCVKFLRVVCAHCTAYLQLHSLAIMI